MPDEDVRRWRVYLTHQMREHFDSLGETRVRAELVRHGYDRPEKHAAALAWLHEKRLRRRGACYRLILSVALMALAAGVWHHWERLISAVSAWSRVLG